MYTYEPNRQNHHLAWQETMELHELTAFQSNQLTHFKLVLNDVKNQDLHTLYMEAISCFKFK